MLHFVLTDVPECGEQRAEGRSAHSRVLTLGVDQQPQFLVRQTGLTRLRRIGLPPRLVRTRWMSRSAGFRVTTSNSQHRSGLGRPWLAERRPPGSGNLRTPRVACESGLHKNATLPQQAAVLVEVVAPVRVQPPRLAAGTSPKTPETERDRVRALEAKYGIIRAQALTPHESLAYVEKSLGEP